MKSYIKRFREDYDDAHLGQTMDDIHAELDKCERKMLDDFDKWKKGKKIKIISAIPRRYVSIDVRDEQAVMLSVLYQK